MLPLRARVNLVAMAIKHSPKLLHYWSLTIRLFSVISSTLVWRVYLQRCSLCILQPQPTGPSIHEKILFLLATILVEKFLTNIFLLSYRGTDVIHFSFCKLTFHLYAALLTNALFRSNVYLLNSPVLLNSLYALFYSPYASLKSVGVVSKNSYLAATAA